MLNNFLLEDILSQLFILLALTSITILGNARLARLLIYDDFPFKPLRTSLIKHSDKSLVNFVRKMFSCIACMSVWLSLFSIIYLCLFVVLLNSIVALSLYLIFHITLTISYLVIFTYFRDTPSKQ